MPITSGPAGEAKGNHITDEATSTISSRCLVSQVQVIHTLTYLPTRETKNKISVSHSHLLRTETA